MTEPRYPHITAQLTGEDGNAFAIIGSINRALRKAGISQEERSEFTSQAMAGDYDDLLRVCQEWVTVQ